MTAHHTKGQPLRLTRPERTRLLEGSYGPLWRKERPDIEAGHDIVVSWTRPKGWVDEETGHVFKPEPEPAMWITVTQVVRRRQGGWRVYFDVEDRREPHWYLSKGGYTRSKAHAIDGLEARVDRKTEARLTTEAKALAADRAKQDKEKQEAEARRQAKRVAARLRDTTVRCARLGVDPTFLIAAVEREIRRQEQEFKEAA